MSDLVKFLILALLCSVILGGECDDCSSQKLQVAQTKTGKLVENKPEWKVTITNTCSTCSQLAIQLSCNGFQTVEDVDPSILGPSGGICYLNSGNVIPGHQSFTFTYAWDAAFPFEAVFSQALCS
uniref:uncharacterized protein At1g05835-like n=1 Tax=Fragaria vesca subsp. vesca TaxID=101020 RepID=UPI0005C9400D|nr:PREDICTED: uncharacterized protein At1g05835-like [Fragaria vesca subsp. vesca]